MKKILIPLSMALGLSGFLLTAGCGSTTRPIGVSVASNATSIDAGGVARLTATITNDRNNSGVKWTLSCSAAPCGTISPEVTTSMASATYTAPAAPPSSDLNVTVTASSVADDTKFDSATVEVRAIAVAVSSPPSSLLEGQSAPFAATVVHDPIDSGVSWTLSCSPAPCSAGSISSSTSGSGAPVMYTAPENPAGDWTITLTATSVTNTHNSAIANFTIPAIKVTQLVGSSTTLAGTASDFAAMVSNDPHSQGVTWTLTDSQDNAVCSPACGSLSLPTTDSGNPTRFTAPDTPPASSRTLILTATSITDSTKTAVITITVPAITVSLAPATINVGISTTQPFSATVQNDSKGGNVNWTLMQNGEPCSPACGSISPASSATGVPITYTAPESVPAPLNVTLTATSVVDTSKSSATTVNIVDPPTFLSGHYVFELGGQGGGMIGSFIADGKGHIVGGEYDAQNASASLSVLESAITGGAYTVKPDGRGTITFTDGARTFSLAFSVGPITHGMATNGALIETDSLIFNSSGTFELQSVPMGFTIASMSGNYAFGLSGWDSTGLVEVAVGSASINNNTVTNRLLDVNDGGSVTLAQSFTKALAPFDMFGRGSFNNFAPTPLTGEFLFYTTHSDSLMVMVVDTKTGQVLVGKMFGQTGGPYSLSSVTGFMVFQMQSSGSSSPQAMVGTLVSPGNGMANVLADVNRGGMMNHGTGGPETYTGTFAFTSASNGRFTTNALGGSTISGYMIAPNQAFLIDMGSHPGFGTFEPGTTGQFPSSMVDGAYFINTLPLVARWNSAHSPTVTSGNMYFTDGALSVICDYNNWGEMTYDEATADSYNASSGYGRVTTMSGNSIMYVVSPQKLILLSTTPGDMNPYIQVLVNPIAKSVE